MRVRTAPAVPHRNEELTMHLFNRLNSRNPEKALDDGVFALEAADLVLKATGQDINVWASVYGRALGTISWTTQVESHAAMAAFGDQLGADSEYHEMIADAAGLFTGLPEDNFSEVLGVAGPGGAVGKIVSLVTPNAPASRAVSSDSTRPATSSGRAQRTPRSVVV